MSELLAKSMLKGSGLAHACGHPQLIETHISWLVLVGDFAYKIKKPVNLGFLDFSTLPRRQHYCEEELRLNRRTAPDIYIDVVPISGEETSPRVGDASDPFEYAVRMHRFDNDALLSVVAERGRLDEAIMHALARAIAAFHELAGTALPNEAVATPASVRKAADDNFRILADLVTAPDDLTRIAALEDWSVRAFARQRGDFQTRRDNGFARECHGDLHLANILYRNGECTLFDCIEFSEGLRWIDVASDIAFTMMDIESVGRPDLAQLLYNEYLQRTGDYGAIAVLDFYLVYRAMVRAKVSAIRTSQDSRHADRHEHEMRRYLDLAGHFAGERKPFLVMMSGLSGSGKTWTARQLAARTGAIHIRSDVERKRLYNLAMEESSHARGIDIYTSDANTRTFDTLAATTSRIVDRRYPVIVDATFIDHALRARFIDLARARNLPWAIVTCSAPEAVVRQRLATRAGDASEGQIDQYLDQKLHASPFDATELEHLLPVDAGSPEAPDKLSALLLAKLGLD